MAIFCVVLISSILSLLNYETLACDNECTITNIPEGNNALTLAGEINGREADIWIKPGKSFKNIVFKLKVDKTFDIHGDVIHEETLVINAAEMLKAMPSHKLQDWNFINISIVDLHVTFWPDRFNIKAQIEKEIFLKDMRLFPLTSEIKSIQVWVQGECKLSFQCHPCIEPIKVSTSTLTLNNSAATNISNSTTLLDFSSTTESLYPKVDSDFVHYTTPELTHLIDSEGPFSVYESSTKAFTNTEIAQPTTAQNSSTDKPVFNTDNFPRNVNGSESEVNGTASTLQTGMNSAAVTNGNTSSYISVSKNEGVKETKNQNSNVSLADSLEKLLDVLGEVAVPYIDELTSLGDQLIVDEDDIDFLENDDILDLIKEATSSNSSNIYESLSNLQDSDKDSISRAKDLQRKFRQYSRLKWLIKSRSSSKNAEKTKTDEGVSESSENMQFLLIYVLVGISCLLLFFLVLAIAILVAMRISKSKSKCLSPEFAFLRQGQVKVDNIYDEVQRPPFFKGPVINGYTNLEDKVAIPNNLYSSPEKYTMRHSLNKKQGSDSKGNSKAKKGPIKHKAGDKVCNVKICMDDNKVDGVRVSDRSSTPECRTVSPDEPSSSDGVSLSSVLNIVNENTFNGDIAKKEASRKLSSDTTENIK